MNYNEVTQITEMNLLPLITDLYELVDYKFSPIEAHDGGRNVVYNCVKEGAEDKIIRIVYLKDRSLEDLLGEMEYVRYLFEQGGSVSNVITSKNGNLVEELRTTKDIFYISLFEKAKGKSLAENNYQYREGAPLTEYFYNCGKVLGKLHQLSKEYIPVHTRYSFFDKYNAQYINQLIPASLLGLKSKILEVLSNLEGLNRDNESFGMVHFDYSDGNYMIDFNTGQITVYDFDNSCFCWYMYDLANLWVHGVGWIQFEPDANIRKQFMEDYFEMILKGYRSETSLDSSILDKLSLFIQVTLIEHIVDAFEVMRNNDEEPECDEELSYHMKCLQEDIPYVGFFHEIYSCEEPFQYTAQGIC